MTVIIIRDDQGAPYRVLHGQGDPKLLKKEFEHRFRKTVADLPRFDQAVAYSAWLIRENGFRKVIIFAEA